MWELVESIRGIKEALEGIGHLDYEGHPLPVVSGNVSLYNHSKNGSVAPSPVIGTLGRIDDVATAVTMQFKKAGSKIYLIGLRKNELGGSEYYRQLGHLGANVPTPNFDLVKAELQTVITAIDEGMALACHDISDGGLAVTLAEMMAGGRGEGAFGLTAEIAKTGELRADTLLFSETGGFVLEITADRAEEFETLCFGNMVKAVQLGEVTEAPLFNITLNFQSLIALPKDQVIETWFNGLSYKLKA
jgi:phosphoribosylformylglycinamidine synthase